MQDIKRLIKSKNIKPLNIFSQEKVSTKKLNKSIIKFVNKKIKIKNVINLLSGNRINLEIKLFENIWIEK